MSETIIEIVNEFINNLASAVNRSDELIKLKAKLDKTLYAEIENKKATESEAKRLAEQEAKQTELKGRLNAAQKALEYIEQKAHSFSETISNMKNLGIPTDVAESSLKELGKEAETISNHIRELEDELRKVNGELVEHEDYSPVRSSAIPTINLTEEEKELFSTTIRDIPMTVGNYKYTNSNGKEVYGLPLYNIEIGEKTFRVQLRNGREDLAPGMEVVVSIDHIQTNDGLRYFAMASVETISEHEERLQEEAEVAAKKKEITAAKKTRRDAVEKAEKEAKVKAMKDAEEGNFAAFANFFNEKFGAAK